MPVLPAFESFKVQMKKAKRYRVPVVGEWVAVYWLNGSDIGMITEIVHRLGGPAAKPVITVRVAPCTNPGDKIYTPYQACVPLKRNPLTKERQVAKYANRA